MGKLRPGWWLCDLGRQAQGRPPHGVHWAQPWLTCGQKEHPQWHCQLESEVASLVCSALCSASPDGLDSEGWGRGACPQAGRGDGGLVPTSGLCGAGEKGVEEAAAPMGSSGASLSGRTRQAGGVRSGGLHGREEGRGEEGREGALQAVKRFPTPSLFDLPAAQ